MEPPPLLVLYGSETGNARDVAERIAREAARDGGGHTMTRRPRRRVHCLPMDSFEVTQLPTAPLIVCVCSTTGQGDPPANMRQFWRFLLRKSLPPDSLADVKFAVFGLGDSHYQKYNVAAKKLHRRMRALGAVELVGLGLGDDQHPTGYEATLDPWLDELWRSLGHGTDAEGGHGDETDLAEDLALDPCRVAVDVVAPPPVGTTQHESHDNVEDRVRELCDAARELDRALEAAAAIPPRLLRGTVGPNDGDPREVAATMSVSSSSGHAFGEYHPAVATVTVNTPLTAADADAEVRHLEVATADLRRAPANSESTTGVPDVLQADERSPLYTPGDCLAVLPLPLAESDVTRARDATGTVLKRAGLAPDAWVTLRAAGGHSEFISKPVRAASLVEGALDLTSASARRYFFEVASTFASHPQEAERLRHFAGKDGRDELWYYNERERRSVGEFLSDFPSVSMPLEWMLTTAPRLRHRLFSIASSPLPHPHALHLTVTAARWKTHYGRVREGLCSNALRRCVSTFIFIRAIRLTAQVCFVCVQRSSRRRAGVLARPDLHGSTEGYHAPGIGVHRVRGGAAQGVRAGTGPQGTGMSNQDCAHVGILRLPEKSG